MPPRFTIGERRDAPMYDTDAPHEPDRAVVHWCMPRVVHDLDREFPSFYDVEYAPEVSWVPSYSLNAEDVGPYLASAYWKGERWARGRTPDDAALRVMRKVQLVDQRRRGVVL
jgi:hypothetical protein